jgi:hypothetical protein
VERFRGLLPAVIARVLPPADEDYRQDDGKASSKTITPRLVNCRNIRPPGWRMCDSIAPAGSLFASPESSGFSEHGVRRW